MGQADMDTTASLLEDTATRLFQAELGGELRRSAGEGRWPARLWEAIVEAGVPLALLPEEAGGYGLEAAEALLPVRLAGMAAAPVPLAETLLASWLLWRSGCSVPGGPLTIAAASPGSELRAVPSNEGWRITGVAERVPWGRDACAAVALARSPDGRDMVASIERVGWRAEHDENLAGEPRDSLTLDAVLPGNAVVSLPEPLRPGDVRVLGAAMRSVQIAGAIRAVLEMTVRYAGERIQFGRPIGRFQAVQQNLAVLASQSAAADAAASMATEGLAAAMAGSRPNLLAIAAAKGRAGEAASIAAAIAHQIHGAIGFTQEHQLHHWTKRLWSWRDEFGNDAEWNGLLGRHLAAIGPDGFWPEITRAA